MSDEAYRNRICPVTQFYCYKPSCQEGNCSFEDYPFTKRVHHSEHKHPETAHPINITIVIPEKDGPPKRDHLWEIIKKQVDTIERLTKIIDKGHHHKKHRNKPIFALTTLINNQTFIMADIQLTLGATPKDGVFALIDSVTGAILTGVSFSKQAIGANSNPSAATFAIDPADTTNNSVLPTPLAAGSGTIGFAATATYTDSTGAVQTDVPFTIVKNFTVVLGADGVTLDVIF